MPSVGMVGQNGREMTRAFLRMCQGTASCYYITEGQHHGPDLDVLVVSGASSVLPKLIPRLTQDCYLVVNADDKEIFHYLTPSQARLITYGFSNKACVTASSVTQDNLHICIQRSFPSLDGTIRDPQEFAAPGCAVPPEVALGAATAWAIVVEYDKILKCDYTSARA